MFIGDGYVLLVFVLLMELSPVPLEPIILVLCNGDLCTGPQTGSFDSRQVDRQFQTEAYNYSFSPLLHFLYQV